MRKIGFLLLLVLIISGCAGQRASEDLNSPASVGPVAHTAEYSVSLDELQDYQRLASLFELNDETTQHLGSYSFAEVDSEFDDFSKAYAFLNENKISPYISADVMLHLFHVQFNESLKELEMNYFYNDLWQIVRELHSAISSRENTHASYQKSYDMLEAYLAIALALLAPTEEQVLASAVESSTLEPNNNLFSQDEFEKYVFSTEKDKALIDSEAQLVRTASGFATSPLFTYQEDYSQYTVRGHYAKSAKLENYFRAMMWLSRMGFLLQGGCPECLVDEQTAVVQTQAATLLAKMLHENEALIQKWQRLYDLSSFYAGNADDYQPADYVEIFNQVYTDFPATSDLFKEKFELFRKTLIEKKGIPMMYAGTGKCGMLDDAISGEAQEPVKSACLNASAGLRLFSQRFAVDAYVLNQLVYPYIGKFTREPPMAFTTSVSGDNLIKGFPRGLELFAVMGSDYARTVLQTAGDTAYDGYGAQFNKMRAYIEAVSEEEWKSNLYSRWLYLLKMLTAQMPRNAPSFMQSAEWKGREMLTALASWTELKHNTVLLVKQGYTPIRITMVGEVGVPKDENIFGYVEPRPDFYRELNQLLLQLRDNLSAAGVLSEEFSKKIALLETFLDIVTAISDKELQGAQLTPEENLFISNFYQEIQKLSGYDETSSVMIADVYTDLNSGHVLQEATGFLKLLFVAYEDFEGKMALAVGPVMSHTEFKQPIGERLNNEQWREIVESRKAFQTGKASVLELP